MADPKTKALEQIATLGRVEISGENPAGSAVRDTSEFETVSTEVGKEESLTAGEVDWGLVLKIGGEILSKQGKDILVAVYVCRAAYEKYGFVGLTGGLNMLNDLLDHYWEGLQPPPKRIRGRRAALEWLVERLKGAIAKAPPSKAQSAEANQAAAALRELARRGEEKMNLQLAELSGTLRLLAGGEAPKKPPIPERSPAKEKAKTSKKEVVVSNEKSSNETGIESKPEPQQRNSGDIKDERKRLRQLQDDLYFQADAWLSENNLDSRAYKIRRVGMWAAVEKAPKAGGAGNTELLAPNPERIRTIAEHLERRRMDDGLPALEALCARHVFWLDGHRMIAGALQAMGDIALPARHAVEMETRDLLQRFPELPTLRFKDGTPYADAATQGWINAQVLVEEGSSTRSGNSDEENKEIQALTREAASLGAGGDIPAGASLLMEAANRASGRLAFELRLETVRYYQRLGRADVGRGVLLPLEEESRKRDLESWDPGLSLELAVLAYECHDADTHGESRQAAFDVIVRLAPERALKLKPKR